ncbi:MAG: hypothetical protein QXO15_08450 [Nitrososphaerota archaeon]
MKIFLLIKWPAFYMIHRIKLGFLKVIRIMLKRQNILLREFWKILALKKS